MPTSIRESELANGNVWSREKRIAASVLIALHLLAVVSAPWSSPPPASELSQRVAAWFRPYTTAAYLNHGYRFFAPDPGPSHIIQYELQLPNRSPVTGRIPDPDRHWPRLIYHRHFMMTETIYNLQRQLPPPDAADLQFESPSARAAFERDIRRTERLIHRLAQGIANQLLRQQGAQRIRLVLQEHEIPFPKDVLEGMRLDDPRLYATVADLGWFQYAADDAASGASP